MVNFVRVQVLEMIVSFLPLPFTEFGNGPILFHKLISFVVFLCASRTRCYNHFNWRATYCLLTNCLCWVSDIKLHA
jgi:hypothetical protein